MASGKAPSIRDVARRAGVSVSTVSNVMANRPSVNPALVARVRAAVEELGYAVDRAASQLASGRSRVVAVLVPNLENPFFTAIIASIEHHLGKLGYDIIVASSKDSEEVELTRLKALASWKPLGSIVVPISDAFRSRGVLEAAEVPFVVADRIVDGHSDVDAVGVDNRAAGVLAGKHLYDLGHREVLVVAYSLSLANVRARCAGINTVFSRGGARPPPILEFGTSFDLATERLEAWFNHNGRPTGIIALTNFATLGVLTALARLSIRIPEEISLVGWDDYVWMRAASPSITAIRQPMDQIGEETVKQLLARIQGSRGPSVSVRLPCELVQRLSTRRLDRSGLREKSGRKA